MITEIITFWGIVQGVGFRPTLSRIAEKYRMKGQVRNMGAFVQLIVTDEPMRIDAFVDAVRAGKPRMADIVRIDRERIDTVRFDSFLIVDSVASPDEIVAVPADIAVCENCLSEFHDVQSPRYMHPFISCTDCGPRYTIMERLPYDRDTTTMDDFPMCDFCESEYKNPATRRYHAQTISCHDCGPQPIWLPQPRDKGTRNLSHQRDKGTCNLSHQGTPNLSHENFATHAAAIAQAIEKIHAGEVIALKGVGGYYFVCDPFSESAVRRLRDIKVREYKPFAIMFSDTAQVREYCEVSEREEELLTSPKRPIVLLECVRGTQSDGPFVFSGEHKRTVPPRSPATREFAPAVLGGSRFIGAFLPSMALQYMILSETGPLVMTSANISDLPIIKDDDVMIEICCEDNRIAGIIYNERRIVRRLDDSVTRIIDGSPQLIRRSKGFTPVPIYTQGMYKLDANDMIFASGGHLKCAFALTKGSLVYMSRYIGDIDNIETERDYEETLASMRAFFAVKPGIIAHDMHPLYWTTEFAARYAEQLSEEHRGEEPSLCAPQRTVPLCSQKNRPSVFMANGDHITLLPVQHHHAHIASVMAEHGLKGQVIGVAFDGTGYGTDETVWGGEILICEGAKFTRFSHLRSITTTGGDPSMRDGWKSAVSRLYDNRCRQVAEGSAKQAVSHAADNGAEKENGKAACAEMGKNIKGDCSAFAPASVTFGQTMKEGFDIDISHIIRYAEENDTLAEYSSEKQMIEAAITAGQNTIITSSMGRLFDAVASLLGIHHANRYEGECAILLENAAAHALELQRAGRVNREADVLALQFHLNVAKAILTQCCAAREACGTNIVCLSGGVFQNKILMEEALRLLRADGFSPYYNITVPTGDGGIALGQAYIAMQHLR